jgi:hypothetical protein
MTTVHPWFSPRPPTLEIPDKLDGQNFSSPDINGSATAGSLSPDVHVNSPPSLFPSPSSVLQIGNYLLTERLADISNGILSYRAVNISTAEDYMCRVSSCLLFDSVICKVSCFSLQPGNWY